MIARLNALTGMARAILGEQGKHAESLSDLPDDVLAAYAEIVGAFAADFRAELERRKSLGEASDE